jgi:hypothetical protein
MELERAETSGGPAELPLAERLRRKEERLQAEATRSLEPWERYRALVDTVEEGIDHLELADRKARFALVIMGALNLGLFLLATRTELVDALSPGLRRGLAFYLVLYGTVALFFFLEAIESLRPRRAAAAGQPPGDEAHRPRGLRDYERAAAHGALGYREAWQDVRLGQLNAELADQAHALALVNVQKYRSLSRLYAGLRVLTLLAGGLLGLVALSLLLRGPRQATDTQAPFALALFDPTAPPASLDTGPC